LIRKQDKEEMAQKKEKRTVDRDRLVFYLRVFDRDSRQMLGHLTDISSAGLMLVCERKIDPGSIYRVRIILPKEVLGRNEMCLKITCRWSRPDAIAGFHVAGFQFDEIDLSQKRLIDGLNAEFSRSSSLPAENAKRPACNLTHTAGR
jgi:hypothetical protein